MSDHYIGHPTHILQNKIEKSKLKNHAKTKPKTNKNLNNPTYQSRSTKPLKSTHGFTHGNLNHRKHNAPTYCDVHHENHLT